MRKVEPRALGSWLRRSARVAMLVVVVEAYHFLGVLQNFGEFARPR